MNLLVDIGNSNFKWCYSNGTEIEHVKGFHYSKENLESLLSSNISLEKQLSAIKGIFVCCVASSTIKAIFSNWLKTKTSTIPLYIESSKESFGVKNAYEIASNLGNDRWLSLVYVHHFYHTDVCIIDCGTAVTIDVILESGQHKGGLIAPGYLSQISALQLKTDIINGGDFINHKKIPLLQNDTDRCVEQGCRLMSLGFIKDVVNQLKQQYGDTLQVVITGGDSESLLSELPENWHYQRDLLFYGLQFIACEKVGSR